MNWRLKRKNSNSRSTNLMCYLQLLSKYYIDTWYINIKIIDVSLLHVITILILLLILLHFLPFIKVFRITILPCESIHRSSPLTTPLRIAILLALFSLSIVCSTNSLVVMSYTLASLDNKSLISCSLFCASCYYNTISSSNTI